MATRHGDTAAMTTGGFPAQTITTETAEKLSRTKEPLDIHDSDLQDSEKKSSDTGARAQTPECTANAAAERVSRILLMHADVGTHIRRTRQLLSDDMPTGLGLVVSQLQGLYTAIQSDDDEEVSHNFEGGTRSSEPDISIVQSSSDKNGESPAIESLSLWEELQRAKTEVYYAKDLKEVSEEGKETMQYQIESMEARIKALKHEKEVIDHDLQKQVDDLQKKVDKLEEENAKLTAQLGRGMRSGSAVHIYSDCYKSA